MEQTVKKIFFALLRFEVKQTEIQAEVKNLITQEILPALYKFAKRQDLAHLIGDALEKNGFLLDGSEAKKHFLKERTLAVYRHEQQRYELEQICQVLEDEKIPFIPLKGSVIRDLYPEAWMRTSCDIDVLVKEEILDKASEILCRRLAYTTDNKRTINDLSLHSPSGVHLELHYDLTEGEKYGRDILSDIWSYTTPSQSKNYQLLLTDEAFYFYHIAHMVKHFESGGCGVRPFVDLWLLNTRLPFNAENREKLLQKGGFLTFAKVSEKLSQVWLDGAELDETGTALEEYILTGGVYGSMQNRVSVQQVKKGSKFKYILSRIFISNKELKLKYPKAGKYPVLIPFYHVVRWFKPLFNRKTAKRSLTELNQTAESTAEGKEKLLKDLDIL